MPTVTVTGVKRSRPAETLSPDDAWEKACNTVRKLPRRCDTVSIGPLQGEYHAVTATLSKKLQRQMIKDCQGLDSGRSQGRVDMLRHSFRVTEDFNAPFRLGDNTYGDAPGIVTRYCYRVTTTDTEIVVCRAPGAAKGSGYSWIHTTSLE